MKSLLLIRHCKSDWGFLGLSDHERPLNERGTSDVPKIAARLNKLKPVLQKVYYSTARRAKDTAEGILDLLDQPIPRESTPRLYTFSGDELLDFINELPESENAVGIVSHNPGLTELIVEITHIRLDNLPTGGFCFVHFDTNSWKDVGTIEGKVDFLEYPKMLG
ncbi:MAG: histidine phosphatase family protein [Bacteroidetes bacterium]|nr:histidine phosphatase family protein [Bacteroidota bacterium]